MDRLGTVRDLAAADGPSGQARIARHLVYDAFGQRVDETVAAVDHLFGFTGREHDEESGLCYYRARYYDPHLGRFLSEDPLGFEAGDANLYRYVQNDPVNKTDPTGLYEEDVHFYMNYYLARYLGLDQPSEWLNSRGRPMSEALAIAYFATRPDYDANTRPAGAGVEARSRFHFPDPNDGQGVREGDPRVRQALLRRAHWGMIEMFGALLHVYQDTFAHQRFGDVLGHMAPEGGHHAPDQPHRRPDCTERMARETYQAMVWLLRARRRIRPEQSLEGTDLLKGKSFEDFWEKIRPTLLMLPPTDDAEAFEDLRVTTWQNLIRLDFHGASPQFNDTSPEAGTPMAQYFREVSTWIARWY
ncbi:MAG: RHS repeat-associated core domain-containing protein [Pirellulaceae bacterium]|nr:RHS repeat-associated core domain-containing protein [Pirellulaceae bacterium]